MIKVLNLYAGIGGNRKLWKDVDVTAVEIEPKIARIYQENFPYDKVIVADAHQFLLEHFEEFDFIWSSPPCPTHSRVRKANPIQNKPIYPCMGLYQEILFLQGYFKGLWVIENVIAWYDPLIKPFEVGGHWFWSNFEIANKIFEKRGISCSRNEIETLSKRRFDLSKIDCQGIEKKLLLRNCVEPELGLHVFNCAFKCKQTNLVSLGKTKEVKK